MRCRLRILAEGAHQRPGDVTFKGFAQSVVRQCGVNQFSAVAVREHQRTDSGAQFRWWHSILTCRRRLFRIRLGRLRIFVQWGWWSDNFREDELTNRRNECLLVGEMPVQRAGGDVKAFGQSAHGHVGKAVLVQDVDACNGDTVLSQLHTLLVYALFDGVPHGFSLDRYKLVHYGGGAGGF